MSIIIKGLDLPPISDTNGFINLSIDCYGQVVVHNTYPTKILKAEQVLIGRLIDADALADQMAERRNYVGRLSDPLCLIEDAPTIIEAEKEGLSRE